MAKRRKLETPSVEDLDRIEDEFRRETLSRGAGAAVAPIAQVAAESAAETVTASPEARAEAAKLRADSEELAHARDQGLLMTELPVDQIDADAMIRDRAGLDEADMLELRLSIAASGLRLPIEVYPFGTTGSDGARYGLVSGYRRLIAVRALLELTGQEEYQTIRAIVRPVTESDAAFVAMVEENEVRAELSHFERGRIAVISAHQGAFVNVEDAVNKLFATASKAKRSKVRSFALIFEELGDMLVFPEALTERRGLQLAQALRQGAGPHIRETLGRIIPQNADDEWDALEGLVQEVDLSPTDSRRGGRPKSNKAVSGWRDMNTVTTSSGITIRKGCDQHGYLLRFEGDRIDAEMMDRLLLEVQALLEPG